MCPLIRRAPRCATVLQIGELPIQAMEPKNCLSGGIGINEREEKVSEVDSSFAG